MVRFLRTIISFAAALCAGCSHCYSAEEVLTRNDDGARVVSTFETSTPAATK
jgi:hypothetical protein